MLIRAFQNQTTTLKSWLGLLLVAFIFYGTTVEAAHRHGRVLPAGSHGVSLVEPDTSDGTLSNAPGCSDCLICQLHQNFSATLITLRPHTAALTRPAHLRRSAPVSIRSISSSPTSGRAPPQAN